MCASPPTSKEVTACGFAANSRRNSLHSAGRAEPRPYQLRLHFNGFCVKQTVYGLRVYLKTPNAPGQRAFLRCAASFFLEIRQYSCEKMSCATQKSLAAGHIMSFQIHPSIRRYVLPLLTSWKQKKSPGSIALQWIRAVRFHDSSLSDTCGHRSRFRHYVLTPPVPFG